MPIDLLDSTGHATCEDLTLIDEDPDCHCKLARLHASRNNAILKSLKSKTSDTKRPSPELPAHRVDSCTFSDRYGLDCPVMDSAPSFDFPDPNPLPEHVDNLLVDLWMVSQQPISGVHGTGRSRIIILLLHPQKKKRGGRIR